MYNNVLGVNISHIKYLFFLQNCRIQYFNLYNKTTLIEKNDQ